MKAPKGRHIPKIETRMMRSVKLKISGKSDNHDMATPPLRARLPKTYAGLISADENTQNTHTYCRKSGQDQDAIISDNIFHAIRQD
jgi:hypothetical protein